MRHFVLFGCANQREWLPLGLYPTLVTNAHDLDDPPEYTSTIPFGCVHVDEFSSFLAKRREDDDVMVTYPKKKRIFTNSLYRFDEVGPNVGLFVLHPLFVRIQVLIDVTWKLSNTKKRKNSI